MNVVQRLFSQEWSALAAAILAGCVVLSLMSPAFLTEFNLYVMLRSFCVVLVVAFAQLLTLASASSIFRLARWAASSPSRSAA